MLHGRRSRLVLAHRRVHHRSVTIPDALIDRLATAKCVSVLTGAGVSAESGVPTFRDAQTGLWAQYRPEDIATPDAFRRDPRLVWEWYEWRRQLVANAKPNPGHFALVELEKLFPQFHLITQNVDGLHQRAGSAAVVELHGNITRTKCFDEDTVVSFWTDTVNVPPKCPRCGGLLRPDVVWFEEAMPEKGNASRATGECCLRCIFRRWHVRNGPACTVATARSAVSWRGGCGN